MDEQEFVTMAGAAISIGYAAPMALTEGQAPPSLAYRAAQVDLLLQGRQDLDDYRSLVQPRQEQSAGSWVKMPQAFTQYGQVRNGSTGMFWQRLPPKVRLVWDEAMV